MKMTERISCLRCRKLKTKCSQSVPNCVRCIRLQVECVYPPPPDRKMIARARTVRKRTLRKPSSSASCSSTSNQFSSSSSTTPDILGGNLGSAEQLQILYQSPVSSAGLSSQAVGLALIDIYFDNFINSYLLFRKQDLIHDYMNNLVPNFILQSIFASSVLICNQRRKSNEPSCAHQPSTISSDPRSESENLAKSATAAIYANIEMPSTDVFYACYNVYFYWFRVGHRNQVAIHKTMMRQAFNLLQQMPQRGLSQELTKRCQWVWWQHQCLTDHGSGPLIKPSCSVSEESSGNENNSWDSKSRAIWQQVIDFSSMWSDVRDFAYTTQIAPEASVMWNRLCRMDAQIELLSTHSPEFVNNSPSKHQSSNELQCVILIWSLYHLCKIVLHKYTYLALKRCHTLEADFLSSFEETCLEVIARHTIAFSKMLLGILVSGVDTAHFTPFVGYCAFVAASIVFCCNWNNEESGNGSPNQLWDIKMPLVAIIYHLGRHFHSIRAMWNRMQPALAKAHITPIDIYDYLNSLPGDKTSSMSLRILTINRPFQPSEAELFLFRNLENLIGQIDLRDPNYLRFSQLGNEVKEETSVPERTPTVDPFQSSLSVEESIAALGLFGEYAF